MVHDNFWTASLQQNAQADGGLQKLRSGEGDAWIVSTGKSAPVIKNIKNEAGKVHLLSILGATSEKKQA